MLEIKSSNDNILCEVCIGIYFPLKHKLKSCHKYPIINEDTNSDFRGLRDRYRGLCLIKNRDGDSEQYVSTNFFGELGYFRELPKADEIEDYSQYLSLDIVEEDVEEKTEVKETPRAKLTYNF